MEKWWEFMTTREKEKHARDKVIKDNPSLGLVPEVYHHIGWDLSSSDDTSAGEIKWRADWKGSNDGYCKVDLKKQETLLSNWIAVYKPEDDSCHYALTSDYNAHAHPASCSQKIYELEMTFKEFQQLESYTNDLSELIGVLYKDGVITERATVFNFQRV